MRIGGIRNEELPQLIEMRDAAAKGEKNDYEAQLDSYIEDLCDYYGYSSDEAIYIEDAFNGGLSAEQIKCVENVFEYLDYEAGRVIIEAFKEGADIERVEKFMVYATDRITDNAAWDVAWAIRENRSDEWIEALLSTCTNPHKYSKVKAALESGVAPSEAVKAA